MLATDAGRGIEGGREGAVCANSSDSDLSIAIGNGNCFADCEPDAADGELTANMAGGPADG